MMKQNVKSLAVAVIALSTVVTTAMAGGILTNTNQSVSFLKNPSRDASIGLDGVYSNPAGVAFMNDGLHLAFNWQYAHQTRTTTWQNPLLSLGAQNNGSDTKVYKGVANAPIIPSLQAAYNTGKWSVQFNFSVPGGGGKCEFGDGLGSFETMVGGIASKLIATSDALNTNFGRFGGNVPTVTGYDVDGYMKGKQYYFGFQLGAAYKLNDHWSVYGGLRLLYGSASYEARLNNIRVLTTDKPEGITLPEYFIGVQSGLTTAGENIVANGTQVQAGIQQAVAGYMAAGMTQEQAMAQPAVQQLVQTGQQLAAAGEALQQVADKLNQSGETLAPYANGVNLKSDQTGWGVAPVIGVDYRIKNFNFAAKYEFKTRMRMKNNSTLKEATLIEATNKFVDGTSVEEDSPALLTVGAEWSVIPAVRVSAGYHHYFDTDAHWYQHSEKKLDGGSNEYLAGVEWDITKKLNVSTGAQITRYQLTDDYMNDMSFVVNSWSFGLGLNYKVTDKVTVSAAYFQTNYTDYNKNNPEQYIQAMDLTIPAGKTSFTRTNKVFGIGVQVDL